MNILASSGIVIGIMVALIIVTVFYKFANTDHKTKTQYDERQRDIRGDAYRISFYVLCIYEAIMVILEYGEINLPVKPYLLHFFGIILSCTVLAGYLIWKGAYWGLNNDRKRYYWFFAATAILNAIPVAGALANGGMVKDGKLTGPFINVIVLGMILALGILMAVRNYLDKQSVEDKEA